MIYLFDFEDSFTLNIFSEIKNQNPKIEIQLISQRDHSFFFTQVLNSDEKCFIILGPGPGHPIDYGLEKIINQLLLRKNVKILGICLGHQLILQALNFEVKKSHNPLHGHSEEYHLTKKDCSTFKLPETIKVQRYNSLGVQTNANINRKELYLFVKDGEVIMAKGSNFLSYQFHPESIGTDDPHIYFLPFLEFVDEAVCS